MTHDKLLQGFYKMSLCLTTHFIEMVHVTMRIYSVLFKCMGLVNVNWIPANLVAAN